MQVTAAQLSKIFPNNKNTSALSVALNNVFPKYEINTVNRMAGFIAQCGHESLGFTVLKENLNYSSDGLRTVFAKYFPDNSMAAKYERKPILIASRVYANRMGNGDEASGEGYTFRGRGALQLTGKYSYTLFAASINKTLNEALAYAETLEGGIESACWFWKNNKLNALCDADDIVAMTKRINGGTNGLNDRKKHYAEAKYLLGGGHSSESIIVETVRLGSRGAIVKRVQQVLGITADGEFGPGTDKALKSWQAVNGLTADGIAGPKTLQKLLG